VAHPLQSYRKGWVIRAEARTALATLPNPIPDQQTFTPNHHKNHIHLFSLSFGSFRRLAHRIKLPHSVLASLTPEKVTIASLFAQQKRMSSPQIAKPRANPAHSCGV
jgi:hypothetical protein